MYKTIQKIIDDFTTAAINADTEEMRMLLTGDVRYWEGKKAEYMESHTIGEESNGNY